MNRSYIYVFRCNHNQSIIKCICFSCWVLFKTPSVGRKKKETMKKNYNKFQLGKMIWKQKIVQEIKQQYGMHHSSSIKQLQQKSKHTFSSTYINRKIYAEKNTKKNSFPKRAKKTTKKQKEIQHKIRWWINGQIWFNNNDNIWNILENICIFECLDITIRWISTTLLTAQLFCLLFIFPRLNSFHSTGRRFSSPSYLYMFNLLRMLR